MTVTHKRFLLLLLSTAFVLAVALGTIRWLMPGLLGVAPDMQLVQLSKQVPAFYSNVFRPDDMLAPELGRPDPRMVIRPRPLYPDELTQGPHDVLGFRNRAVPNVADVITIGDSQTYGIAAALEENWPSRLHAHLPDRPVVVYNMSFGGWSGPQYLEILASALRFAPRVIVVAFYSGNDAAEAFAHAYGADHWASLRLEPRLKAADAPPVPERFEHVWMRFSDGSQLDLTPRYRLRSNRRDDPTVQTGYAVLAEVARRIHDQARRAGVAVVFTIVPTKELVYASRAVAELSGLPPEYGALIAAERSYRDELAAALSSIPEANYVDLLPPLQEAARGAMLYPEGNGHPNAAGHEVIARTLAPHLRDQLPAVPHGLVLAALGDEGPSAFLVRDGCVWRFATKELATENGWDLTRQPRVAPRELAGLAQMGTISVVDPDEFGPGAIQ